VAREEADRRADLRAQLEEEESAKLAEERKARLEAEL
jgi:hypothetical protein